MKRLMIVSVMFFVFSIPAFAQMGGQHGQMGQGMMMGEGQQMMKGMTTEGQQMPMMQMCMPMMKQMMGHGMMMRDMMQMMMEMMNMQEKMMRGTKAAQKKQMMNDMAQMREKMQKMMLMRMGMMGTDDSQSKLKCAEQWLKKAIYLHELHMKDPKTTTDASQMELMDQIKKAYGCVAGTGSEMIGTPSKELESKEPGKTAPPKSDPHKH